MGDDDIDTRPDKCSGELLSAVNSPIRIAELDLNVPAFGVAEGVQTAPESISEWMRRRRRHQHSNPGRFSRLLRARRERPGCRRTAEQRDELPSFHSITLSAATSSLSGTVRPSTLAVVRLMMKSNLVGCSTGRSLGFAPRRILST